jgi:ribonuclease P protein component
VENKKIYRLRSKNDFALLSTRGQTVFGSHWLIFKVLNHEEKFHKLGWTVPKYVGNAVLRNKFKRWLREILENKKQMTLKLSEKHYSLNLILRKKNASFYQDVKFEEFERAVLNGLRKIKKIQN